MSVDYRPNRGSLTPILRSDRMAEVVDAAAEVIAARARSLAPVATGGYQQSIQVVSDVHPTRVAAHVGAHVDYALVVESRSAVLRRSLG